MALVQAIQYGSGDYDNYDDCDEAGTPCINRKNFDSSYVQWSSPDGSTFVPAAKTVNVLPPGVYEVNKAQGVGTFFESVPVKTEGLIRFPETSSNKVVSEISKFWDRENLFKEYGLSYKRGIMLYGPPGSGKSCTVQLIMQDVVRRGGIVIKMDNPYIFCDGFRVLRKIQPDTPVVTIMEDIDELLDGTSSESHILNILDGMECMHKVVFLATTNYPEKLGPRIMNRPSRFDKRFRIGFPSEKSRRMYFEHLIGSERIKALDIDLDRWVKDTDKLSIAHLKELFVAVVILGDEYRSAIKTLKLMKETVDNKDFNTSLGFVSDEEDNLYD